MYLHGTGSQFPGKPNLSAWVVYGLGSENQNLPAYVVMRALVKSMRLVFRPVTKLEYDRQRRQRIWN